MEKQLLADGYKAEAIDFAIQEIRKGANALTIQILLERNYATYSTQAIELIEKIKQRLQIEAIMAQGYFTDNFTSFAFYIGKNFGWIAQEKKITHKME